jgi:hypothetical protein
MNWTEINDLLKSSFPGVPDNAKLWVYQAEAPLNESQSEHTTKALADFVTSWSSHGIALKAYGKLFFNQFVVLCVDEAEKNASGCSIDSSMRFIKDLESSLSVSFTNRMKLAWLNASVTQGERSIQTVSLEKLPVDIHEGTYVFNNLVTSLGDWKSSWLSRAGDIWVKRFIVANNPILSSLK